MADGIIDLLTALGTDIGELLGAAATGLCNIERKTLDDDGNGGKAETWEAINDDPLPCVAYPGSGRTHLLGEVPTARTAFTVIVAGGTDVKGKDRVRLLAGGTEPERLVDISHVLPQMGVIVEIVGLVNI